VSEDDENIGLDVSQHGERGYVIEEPGPLAMAPQVSASTAPTPEPSPGAQRAPEAGGAAR
jgi:hypothetical protein